MVYHKKHEILTTIRDAILVGDTLEQAKSICLIEGYLDIEIRQTLSIYDEFKARVGFKEEDFWDLLTYEVFDLALKNKDFNRSLNASNNGVLKFDLQQESESFRSLLDKFRLLEICKYSGFKMIIHVPHANLMEFHTPNPRININKFEEILAKKKALGLEGELFVIKEEQKRLGIDFLIEHTSQINVGAGYDIQSWKNGDSFSQSNELYIEVKTFSIKKEIYLTENEITTAKKLGVNYRLHIVRKVNNKFYTYRIIDDFYTFFKNNEEEFYIQPTFLLKV